MLSLAVIRKTARDALPLFGVLLLAAVAFEILFIFAIGELAGELRGFMTRMAVLRRLVGALVGADLLADLSPTTLATIGLAHPVLYTLTWTLLLGMCTRVPSGEMDRGTADLLLTLPISRARIYLSVSLVAVGCAAAMSFAPLAGIAIGEQIRGFEQPVDLGRLWRVAGNLFALNLGVCAAALMCSTISARRGIAIGVVLGWLLGSFLFNFLAQFWPAAEKLTVLLPLHYYRPLPIVRDAAWPIGSMLVLLGFAAICWFAGLWHFHRRDIPAA